MPDSPSMESGNRPMSPVPRTEAAESGARLRPALGVWLRDLIVSLAISAFIIVFIYPAGEGGRHEHDVPSLEDQERIFTTSSAYRLEVDFARGHRRVPLSARSVEELYQACDWRGRRSHPHRQRPSVRKWRSGRGRLRSPAYADSRSYPETVVPAECYFVLGDHRTMSNDSRDFGPVNQSYIYGKAVFGYWPMDKVRVR